MRHFGIAFGVIIATAIGGAVVFDRYESHKTLAIPHPAAPAQAADAAADRGSGASAPSAQIAQADQPAIGKVELAQAPVPKADVTTKKTSIAATPSRPARSPRASSSTSVDVDTSTRTQDVTPAAPAPADTAPATPAATGTTTDQAPSTSSASSTSASTQEPPAAQ